MSDDQTFDSENFLDDQTEQSINTSVTPVPEGDYPAVIVEDSIKVRNGVSTKTGNAWYMMDITWEIDDPALAEEIGRDPVHVRQSVFLDMTAAGGLDLGKGKNRQLGFLRAAVGQNADGSPWTPRMLQGQAALVNVGHRANQDNPEIIYDEVRRVAPLS